MSLSSCLRDISLQLEFCKIEVSICMENNIKATKEALRHENESSDLSKTHFEFDLFNSKTARAATMALGLLSLQPALPGVAPAEARSYSRHSIQVARSEHDRLVACLAVSLAAREIFPLSNVDITLGRENEPKASIKGVVGHATCDLTCETVFEKRHLTISNQANSQTAKWDIPSGFDWNLVQIDNNHWKIKSLLSQDRDVFLEAKKGVITGRVVIPFEFDMGIAGSYDSSGQIRVLIYREPSKDLLVLGQASAVSK